MKKFILLITINFLVFAILTAFTSIKANSQVAQQNSNILQLNHLSQFSFENIENANNHNNYSLEEFELKSGFENTVKLDSFVYEAFDKNQSKWIRTGKYKNGTTQNLLDTVWFIALWIDSTKSWKEYPTSTVQYNSNGKLIKKEFYGNSVGSTILVNTKIENNFSYSKEDKTELTIIYNRDYFTQELVYYSKTETSFDEKDRITSKTMYLWDKNQNQWNGTTKDTIHFDEFGNNTLKASYRWNVNDQKWFGSEKTKKQFSANGNLLMETNFLWGHSVQNWIYYTKTENSYEENEELISTHFVWNSIQGDWEKHTREIEKHNNFGLLILHVDLSWDSELSQWKNIHKYEGIFDSDSNQVIMSQYWWDNDSNWWKGDLKVEKEFAAGKKELSKTESVWNNNTGSWNYEIKEKYNYDHYGNLELTEIFKWNSTLNEWEFKSGKSKSEYTYNESGKINEQVYSVWNSENEKWQYAEKNEYTWNSQNRLILHINSNWIIERNEWIKIKKLGYAFDSEGRYILDSNSHWDEVKNDWKITTLYEWGWDFNDYQILNSHLQWNGFGDIYWGNKSELELNERGQILWNISYSWDNNLQQWKAGLKRTNIYTYEGLIDTTTLYVWDISLNEWIANVRTIYYYSGQVLDVNEIHTETNVKLYPNLSKDFIYVEIAENQQKAQFELFDINGRQLINKNFVQSENVDLHNLKDGIYPWKITLKEKTFSGKIVVKR